MVQVSTLPYALFSHPLLIPFLCSLQTKFRVSRVVLQLSLL